MTQRLLFVYGCFHNLLAINLQQPLVNRSSLADLVHDEPILLDDSNQPHLYNYMDMPNQFTMPRFAFPNPCRVVAPVNIITYKNGIKTHVNKGGYSKNSQPEPVRARLRKAGDGRGEENAFYGCFRNDFSGANYTGTIALVSRGQCNFSSKVANANSAGAIGLIIVNDFRINILRINEGSVRLYEKGTFTTVNAHMDDGDYFADADEVQIEPSRDEHFDDKWRHPLHLHSESDCAVYETCYDYERESKLRRIGNLT